MVKSPTELLRWSLQNLEYYQFIVEEANAAFADSGSDNDSP